MELVEIIYTILFIVFSLLLIIVAASYIFGKTNKRPNIEAEKVPNKNIPIRTTPKQKIENRQTPITLSKEQNELRENKKAPAPKIFHIAPDKQREIKIVRQPTSQDIIERLKMDVEQNPKTNSKAPRYTIVNNKSSQENHAAANFYL